MQLYVGKVGESPVPRAVRELRNYEKIYLEPGEEQQVTMALDKSAFSYYDVTEGIKDFVVDNGTYNIELGVSSRDIKLSHQVNVNYVQASIPLVETSKATSNLYPSIVTAGETANITLGTATSVEVYNLCGKVAAYFADTAIVPTVGLTSGIYLVRYIVDNITYTEKLVVR